MEAKVYELFPMINFDQSCNLALQVLDRIKVIYNHLSVSLLAEFKFADICNATGYT